MITEYYPFFCFFRYYKLSSTVFLPSVTDNGYVLVKDELFEIDELAKNFLKRLPLTKKEAMRHLSVNYNQKDADLLIRDFLKLDIIESGSGFNVTCLSLNTFFSQCIREFTNYIKGFVGVYPLTIKCYLIKRKLRRLKGTLDPTANDKPKTILLIMYGGIGDMVLASPMLQCLKENMPNTLIDVVVKAKYASFLESCPLINRIIKYPGNRHAFKWLGKPSRFLMLLYQKYDITIGCCEHFGGNCRWFTGKALNYLVDADMRIGTLDRVSCKHTYITRLFLTHGVKEYYEHEAIRMLRLLEPMGVAYSKHRATVWENRKGESAIEKFNISTRLSSTTYTIGISPFTGIQKQWPLDRYAKIIEYLSLNYDATVILLGAKRNLQEAAILRCLVGKNDNIINLTGMTTTKDLITIIRRLSLLISPDSGPAHIATACQIPEIVLFGYTNPHRYCPWMNPKSTLLRTQTRKVRDISVDIVCKAIQDILVNNNKHIFQS